MTEKFSGLSKLTKETGFLMMSYFQTFLFPSVVNTSILPVSLSNKTPSEILIQEQQKLALAIEVKPFRPRQLTEEFLKQEKIIPLDWKQKRFVESNGVQLDFEEGVSILARNNLLILRETVEPQKLEKMLFSTVAHRLIDQLKNKRYLKIQLELQRSFSIPSSANFGISYLKKSLLSPRFNQWMGDNLISGEINYYYQLEHCKLSLKVKSFSKHKNNELSSPMLVFTGNFNYRLEFLTLLSPLHQLKTIISNWQLDHQNFINIINTKFLG